MNIRRDFQERVQAHGVKYGNLLDFLNSKARDGALGEKDGVVTENEFRDALRNLEEENEIQIFGHSRAPTIRFIS